MEKKTIGASIAAILVSLGGGIGLYLEHYQGQVQEKVSRAEIDAIELDMVTFSKDLIGLRLSVVKLHKIWVVKDMQTLQNLIEIKGLTPERGQGMVQFEQQIAALDARIIELQTRLEGIQAP